MLRFIHDYSPQHTLILKPIKERKIKRNNFDGNV